MFYNFLSGPANKATLAVTTVMTERQTEPGVTVRSGSCKAVVKLYTAVTVVTHWQGPLLLKVEQAAIWQAHVYVVLLLFYREKREREREKQESKEALRGHKAQNLELYVPLIRKVHLVLHVIAARRI